VEGKKEGIDEELVYLLARYSPIPVTYAGGVSSISDLERIRDSGDFKVDVTIGSALDLFGGNLNIRMSSHGFTKTLINNSPALFIYY
jgi:phosphoribosylformimino-5-aminoimidazole carboxamide ribotide isomerase